MSDQKVPQAPDYGPMIAAFNGVAQNSATNGANSLQWAQGQVANNQNLVDQVNNGTVDTASQFGTAGGNILGSSQDLQRQGTGYLQNEVQRYTDPTQVAQDMGASEAQTGQGMDAARNSSLQELESYGVNPAATRYAGLDAGLRAQKAAAQAAAGTTAALNDRQLADNANGQLLGQGNAENAQANSTAATGTNAGTAAVDRSLAQTSSGNNSLGTDLAWTGAQTGALSGGTSAQNTGFQNQATSDQISNSSSSGIGSALGLGASVLGKTLLFANGGSVPDGNTGGVIPDTASPSGGAVTDDIPASTPWRNNIRLNGGEEIIPKDVSQYFGKKFFMDLIMKARKAMEPDQVQRGGPPKFASGGAIPGTPGGNPPSGQGPMENRTAAGAIGGGKW